jgi:glycosyltransferase involved in cell wall biosynthesis
MRICIVAEHASYRFGGEAVLPLHYFSRLRSRGVEAWIIVHSRTQAELEEAFPSDKHRFRFVEDTWLHRLLLRLSRFLPRRVAESTLGLLSQLLTQYLERKLLKVLIAEESIGIVHQPIPVSPRFPSLMGNLGVPVIIGPMNGGMEYPPSFRTTESMLSRVWIQVGRRLSGLANLVATGKTEAAILLVANQRTHHALHSNIHGQVIELLENGVDLKVWSPCAFDRNALCDRTERHRFVFIGRLVDWKGVDMAIEAVARVPDAHLEIVGDGPMRAAWQQLALELGVSTRVVFSGWLPQRTCAERLRSAAGLLLPSIYECGGAVVLEAMAMETPVIATAWGGPVDYLGENCGLLIEPTSREAIVQGFSSAMQTLIDSPELGRKLGFNGRKRVEQKFDWEKKIDRIISIYMACLQ